MLIKQNSVGLDSRTDANPYDKNGMLPIITAPMFSVVNEENYQVFLDNKIHVCLPRKITYKASDFNDKYFTAISLDDFKRLFIDCREIFVVANKVKQVCIDTANGNIPALHDAIIEAKKIHGSNLIIMAGNVSSEAAFMKLSKTGVDYIRVGIGGGGGCNTTSNTAVGQEDLSKLVSSCYNYRLKMRWDLENMGNNYELFFKQKGIPKEMHDNLFEDVKNTAKVKIVADGISSYVDKCIKDHNFNDNGYAAINSLLYAGADLVMCGKLFVQCLESAGQKAFKYRHAELNYETDITFADNNQAESELFYFTNNNLHVKYSGMSTQAEQAKYKKPILIVDVTKGDTVEDSIEIAKSNDRYVQVTKPSEGSVSWIPVRWRLQDWLHGNETEDNYPYLMGWINSLKSAMSYVGAKTLQDFK